MVYRNWSYCVWDVHRIRSKFCTLFTVFMYTVCLMTHLQVIKVFYDLQIIFIEELAPVWVPFRDCLFKWTQLVYGIDIIYNKQNIIHRKCCMQLVQHDSCKLHMSVYLFDILHCICIDIKSLCLLVTLIVWNNMRQITQTRSYPIDSS